MELDLKEKIGLFCNVPVQNIIAAPDVSTIYEIPLLFKEQKLDAILLACLNLKPKKNRKGLQNWIEMVQKIKFPKKEVNIAIAGKYMELKDSYKSLIEALIHGGISQEAHVNIRYIDVTHPDLWDQLKLVSGILVPGGFGDRGIESKIAVVSYARTHNIPFLGICLGMQCAVIDIARHLAHLKEANSTEFNPHAKHPVIHMLAEQKNIEKLGGTMRLGVYPCKIKKNTMGFTIYKKENISERHRHRYELNNKFRKKLETAGLVISGEYTQKKLSEIIELKTHPWFVAVQFHPELKSRPLEPHPIFKEFIKAALTYGK